MIPYYSSIQLNSHSQNTKSGHASASDSLPLLKHIILKTKVAIFAEKSLFASEKHNKVQ